MKTSKRILSLILCCIMIVSLLPMTVSADVTHIYYGDLNENGRVEASDARLVLQKAASLITLTDRQMALADVNQDGRVSAMDARTVLRTAARIEAPVVFETNGTEDETVDYIALYTDFLRKQGKSVSSNAEYGGKTGSVRNYKFSDAVICNINADNNYPELVVCYSGTDLYTLYRFYHIEDGAVTMFKEFVDVRGMYSYGTVKIWNDPCKNLFSVLHVRVSAASMHSEYDCEIIYPTENKIISIASAYDHASATMKTTAEYADGYDTYFEYDNRADVDDAVNKYCLYEFRNTESSLISLTVIDENGKTETLSAAF
ncbi:MAG: dockerin type I repeat-containing protein [Clostridia bacterium]|nr:dockerin type I repeat-containing protein [Clostridia bacterium]